MRFEFDHSTKLVEKSYDTEWFEWTIRMAKPEDLSEVRKVVYYLHRSFPNPIRTIVNRDSRFALTSIGTGDFILLITVHMEDGTEVYTEYCLDSEKDKFRNHKNKSDKSIMTYIQDQNFSIVRSGPGFCHPQGQLRTVGKIHGYENGGTF